MKKIMVSFVVGILFLGFSTVTLAASNKPTPRAVEKVTFIHHAKPTEQSKPIWDETVENFKLIAGGVKWPVMINYEVNPAGSGLDPELTRSTLEVSSETWDSKTSFELFASPALTSQTTVGYDEENRIIWGSLDPGVIAVTYLWYSPAVKQIVEFDMIFNTAYLWSTTGAENAMDLANIATHEFGHNGLGDLRPPKDWALTMYGFSSLGETTKRTLGTGDILGIQKLYGL